MPYAAQEMPLPPRRSRTSRSTSSSITLPIRGSRQPPSIFKLLSLPTEIRLLIIGSTLPNVNDVSQNWPAPIPSLLRTSRQINAETKHVMAQWSPIHYLPDWTYVPMIPQPGVVRVENICLSMFHYVLLDALRPGLHTDTRLQGQHHLIREWLDHVGELPMFESIKTVTIDATPSPGWIRHDKPSWLPRLVNDKSVSERFIYEHVVMIADLACTVSTLYNSVERPDPVSVELGGFFGTRSASFPRYVNRRCARSFLDIPFTGELLAEPPPRYTRYDQSSNSGGSDSHGSPMTIKRAISELYDPRSVPDDRRRSRQRFEISQARLRLENDYEFSLTSKFLFENIFAEAENWTMAQLERITDFVLLLEDSEDIRFDAFPDSLGYDYHNTSSGSFRPDQPGSSSRRRRYDRLETGHRKRPPSSVGITVPDFAAGSFICSLAKDFGLQSDWRGKEVKLYQDPRRRLQRRMREEQSHAREDRSRAAERKRFSVISDLLVTGVAIAALAAIMHQRHRIDRRSGGGS